MLWLDINRLYDNNSRSNKYTLGHDRKLMKETYSCMKPNSFMDVSNHRIRFEYFIFQYDINRQFIVPDISDQKL